MHSKTAFLLSCAWSTLKVYGRGIRDGNLFVVLEQIDQIKKQAVFFHGIASEIYQCAMISRMFGDQLEFERLSEQHSLICRRYQTEVVDAYKKLTGENL